MTRQSVDIAITGAGIAGLIAANAFAAKGCQVALIEPHPFQGGQIDHRSTAFLQPARRVLEAAGLWAKIADHATPLRVMRLLDAGGVENEIREVADFDAAELDQDCFGWNFPNHILRSEFYKAADAHPNITFHQKVEFRDITTRQDCAFLRLSNGLQIKAKLAIGADGRNSPLREAIAIEAKTTRYGQRAIVFAIAHERAHQNISSEIHRTGGPFTTVPLADADGRHRSSVVWMEDAAKAQGLLALTEAEFEAAVNERSCNILGAMKVISDKGSYPIITQSAKELIGQRTALIAEAAHVVPPIGAQGLNMSLADIALLVALSEEHELGSDAMLASYQAARSKDIALRIRGVDMLNRAAMTNAQNLRDLRVSGLRLLHRTGALKTQAMRRGLGG